MCFARASSSLALGTNPVRRVPPLNRAVNGALAMAHAASFAEAPRRVSRHSASAPDEWHEDPEFPLLGRICADHTLDLAMSTDAIAPRSTRIRWRETHPVNAMAKIVDRGKRDGVELAGPVGDTWIATHQRFPDAEAARPN